MPTLAELQHELGTAIEGFKVALTRHDTEIAEKGDALAETKALVDAHNARIDEVFDAVKGLNVKLNRPVLGSRDGTIRTPEAQERMEAFLQWGRKGMEFVTPDQRTVLTIADDTGGGILAPSEFVQEILKTVVEFSDIRSVSRVRQTSANSVKVPKRTGTFTATWVVETGTRSERTGLAYGMEEVPNHELYALVDVSFEDLEDSAFDLEAELAMEFGEQFAVAEGTAFVSGNAVGRPEGILTNSDIGEVAGTHASELRWNGFIDLYGNIKSAHARNAVWLMRRTTIQAARKLTDGQGQYLWEPNLRVGEPQTILGRPILEAPDMPAVAANAYPVVFGNMGRGYLVVDRINMTIQRDPYTQADSGAVRFRARRRVGGQVVLAEALSKMKIATSV